LVVLSIVVLMPARREKETAQSLFKESSERETSR